jgi:DNA mismatch repair protein MutS2
MSMNPSPNPAVPGAGELQSLSAWLFNERREAAPPPVSPRTLAALDWPRLLAELAQGAGSRAASALLEAIEPITDEALLRARFSEVSEMLWLLARAAEPVVSDLDAAAGLWDRARRGETLFPDDLAAVARHMRCTERVRFGFAGFAERAPWLTERSAGLVVTSEVARLIEGSLDPDGQIADHASPDLGPLRREASRLRRTVIERLERILRSPRFEGILQDEFYTQRDDRYVVPVRAGERGDFPGIVHGHSGSGATLFIEPHEIVSLNNELKVAELAVTREVHRVLSRLTSRVAEVADSMAANHRILVYLDATVAIARFGRLIKADVPRLVGREASPVLHLLGARHPLLALRAARGEIVVVANDIVTQPQHRGLIISGPNTGGKTVTLKTVGLFSLMLRCGLPLPCEPESQVPWFDQVFADIGDAQTVENDLSTFSAHVTHIQGFLPQCGPRTLVLLDELFGATDPDQGAALGKALIERLVARGSWVLATTHLAPLRELSADHPAFESASVGFDVERLEPTFRLRCGVPGSSYALSVARRLGFDADVLAAAELNLKASGNDRERVIERLETLYASVEAERAAASAARAAAERDAAAARALREELTRKRREVLDEEAARARAELRTLRETLRAASQKLRAGEQGDVQRAADLAAEAGRALGAAESEAIAEARSSRSPLERRQIKAGARVWVASLQKPGVILSAEADGSRAVVQLGALRTTVEAGDLYHPTAQRQARRIEGTPRPVAAPVVELPPAPDEVQTRLDLRGVSADEAIEALDAFLDRAVRGGWPGILVVHGHGTGILKRAIRDHLVRSAYVRSFRAGGQGEGGDGVTVVSL